MRRLFAITLTCFALAAAGCNGAGGGTRYGPAPEPGIKATEGEDSYSVLLATFNNPDGHAELAEFYRERLVNKLGWRDAFVVNHAGRSEVFRGRFRSVDGARAYLRQAKAHRASDGSQPFASAMIVPLPGEDIGPDEWNLRNSSATYSLTVATFYNVPEKGFTQRRRAAVEHCRDLREQGLEAFFYHGTTASHVMVGEFGRDAVSFFVRDGVEQTQINDPGITRLQQRFPHMAVNGGKEVELIGTDPSGTKRVEVAKSSQLMRLEKYDPQTRTWVRLIGKDASGSDAAAGARGAGAGRGF
jgi:hypothetical protein